MTESNRAHPIIVKQAYSLPVTRVWQAITDPGQMTKWFFENIPAFEARVGFRTSFPVFSGERLFTHLWEIIEVIPRSRIKYLWRYAEYEGQGFVTFDLLEKGDCTILQITNEGLESFPEDVPEFQRESCEGGWKYFINQNLKRYLEYDL